MSLVLFLGGLLAQTKVDIGGELFLVQLFLLGLLPFTIATGGLFTVLRKRDVGVFLLLNMLMIFAYIISDLIHGSDVIPTLKGLVKPVLLLVDWLTLTAATRLQPKRMGWFLSGTAVGTIVVNLFFSPHLVFFEQWKLGLGGAVATLAMLSNAILPFLFFVGATVIHAIFSFTQDSRSLGAFVLLSGVLTVFVRMLKGRANFLSRNFALIIGVTLSVAIVGVLLQQGSEIDSDRRTQSNIARTVGIISGLYAIAESPFLGYGSSPTQPKLSRILNDVYNEQLRKHHMGGVNIGKAAFNPHSKILQVWVEAGIVAAPFFLFLALRIGQSFLLAVNRRPYDWFSPVYIFIFMGAFWSLFMSPFGAGNVLSTATPVVLCLMIRDGAKMASGQSQHHSNDPISHS